MIDVGGHAIAGRMDRRAELTRVERLRSRPKLFQSVDCVAAMVIVPHVANDDGGRLRIVRRAIAFESAGIRSDGRLLAQLQLQRLRRSNGAVFMERQHGDRERYEAS